MGAFLNYLGDKYRAYQNWADKTLGIDPRIAEAETKRNLALQDPLSPESTGVSFQGAAPGLPHPSPSQPYIDSSISKIESQTKTPTPDYLHPFKGMGWKDYLSDIGDIAGTAMQGPVALALRPMRGGKTEEDINQWIYNKTGTLIPNAASTALDLVSGYQPGGGGVQEGVVPTRLNFEKFFADLKKNYRLLPKKIDSSTKLGIALRQTQTPRMLGKSEATRFEGIPEARYHESLGRMFDRPITGTVTTEMGRKPILKIATEPEGYPATSSEAAGAISHEYNHVQQILDIQKRLTQARGYPVSIEEAAGISGELYKALGLLGGVRKIGMVPVSSLPPPEQMETFINEKLADPNYDPGMKNLLHTVLRAGYEPREFPRLLEKFQPPTTAEDTLFNIMMKPRDERVYEANPHEIWSYQAQRTGAKSVDRFKDLYREMRPDSSLIDELEATGRKSPSFKERENVTARSKFIDELTKKYKKKEEE